LAVQVKAKGNKDDSGSSKGGNKGGLSLRIFIDSANIDEVKEINEMGFLAGVTTNPTLVAKEKRDYREVIQEICRIVDGPISAEVISSEYEQMVLEAEDLAAIHPNVVIKIPLTESGLRAISTLKRKGIPTNATLVFSANQALLAARAGAAYVSPFLGRVDDYGNDGLTLLSDILTIFDQYVLQTEVIAASIRHPMHVVQAALLGSHIATVPYNVLKQMVKHPLTDAGIEKFMADWKKAF
jgi:transaldolase